MQNSGYPFLFERQDAIKESRQLRPIFHRKTKRSEQSNATDFSHLSQIKLNKNKKYLLQEEKNTEIDRSNRILYQKLAKCAKRSEPSIMKHSKIESKHKKSKKLQTLPNSPITTQQNSRHKTIKQQSAKTLFMGHEFIDGVEFKIKLVITNQIYYLIAQNQHTKIILEMPEQEYWALHYGQLHENPCNIFQYLQIEKGRIQFRTREKEQMSKYPAGIRKRNHGEQEQLILKRQKKRKKEQKKRNTSLELPKINA